MEQAGFRSRLRYTALEVSYLAHTRADTTLSIWSVMVVGMNVYACFELNGVDAPILRGIKSYSLALDWRNADLLNRYFVCFALDAEPEVSPPRDLFEWAERNAEEK